MPSRERVRRLLVPVGPALLTLSTVLMLSGCGGGSAASPPRTLPDINAFLRLPVASPSSCPPSVSGSTSGHRSPWVGHVDISVFVAGRATPAQVAALRARLTSLPQVSRVYFESHAQAYAEFQRLYTCSAQVSPATIPASYRLVLRTVTRPQRDDLVRTISRLPAVRSVSCDPSSPCVDVTSSR